MATRHEVTVLVVGEVGRDVGGELFMRPPAKSAPAYYEISIPRQVAVGQERATVGGREVVFDIGGYPPDVITVRATTAAEDLFGAGTFELEEGLYREARRIFGKHGGVMPYREEFTLFVTSGYEGGPEQFLKHAGVMASLLKSERLELDPREVAYTMHSQIKYAKDDLAIVDWDGAFLFDPEGDVEEEVTLLTIANLQLLRHRILDRQLDQRLLRMASLVRGEVDGRLVLKHEEIARDLMEIVRYRMQSISELQRLEREIKLIGDWYSARLYELAAGKFKIGEWRRSIQTKLGSIEDIYSVVAENFSVSAKHRVEWIQIIAFFVLQAGWFVLIILEMFYFTRK